MFKLGIAQRIMALATAITIVLVGLLVVSNYLGQQGALDSSQAEQLNSYNQVFWDQVDQDAKSLEKLLTVMTRDTELVDIFHSGDRDALLAKSQPIFEAIRKAHDITHFYFIDTAGKVFLRAHNPPKRDDVLKRATFMQARDSGKLGKGIEMGKKYFSLRVVMPVRRDGELVGYFELGEELDHFIKGFKNLTGADVSLWVSGDYARQRKLTEVFKETKGWYEVMASDAGQQEQIMTEAVGRMSSDGVSAFDFGAGDRDLRVQTFPFKDAFGTPAGVLMIANDVTEIRGEFGVFMSKVIGIAVVLLAVFAGLSLWLSRSITRPIRTANAMLRDIAEGEGDLTRRLEVHSNDEVGELAGNFNRFVANLQATISRVAAVSAKVNEAGGLLSDAANDASSIVSRQRGETEQVAAAINEMAATIHEVAGNASAAAGAADEADGEAVEGRAKVMDTVAAIRDLAADVEKSSEVISRLKSESENIGTVLDVIKGIAEQTNLLALNAAIEAARAGEQGRGFAVVADEVRSLAQRTQESTQEIEKMIDSLQGGANDAEAVMGQSRERAQATVEQASNAGASLESIAASVGTIRDMNTQIATASEEQSAVAEEVNKNIAAIHGASEEVELGTANMQQASGELSQHASELQQVVARFRI